MSNNHNLKVSTRVKVKLQFAPFQLTTPYTLGAVGLLTEELRQLTQSAYQNLIRIA